MSDPQASSSSNPRPTILSHLHTLLDSHQLHYPNPSLPYLHPYAPPNPSAWKGKSRELPLSAAAQLEVLKQLRETVEAANRVLGRTGGKDEDRERVKLARALKETTTYPLTSSLSSLPPTRPPKPTLPSSLVLLPPIELLTSLAQTLSIQTYLEDSQFGLLKTSLALAGNRFVVDVDLETDAIGNEDEDEERDIDIEKRMEGRGRVRLSKLTSNHVGPGGGTGKSDWVATVLRGRLEKYLDAWNEGDRGLRLEVLIRGLEGELRELRMLDDLVVELGEGEVPEYFADLEEVAKRVEDTPLLLQPNPPTIFPSFRILNSSPSISNPIFRMRPFKRGEAVPAPTFPSDDMPIDDKPWLSGAWVLEYVGDDLEQRNGIFRGLLVRQSWLSRPGGGADRSGTWDGLVKVERLLYAQQRAFQSEAALDQASDVTFPYTSDFVARPVSAKDEGPSLVQRWSMAQSGPEGFVVARIGVPVAWTDFERLIEAVRNQVILNELFCSVFRQRLLDHETDEELADGSDDGDSLGDLDDLMSAPTAIPLTVILHQRSLRIVMPFPHVSEDGHAPTLTLVITPTLASPDFIDIRIDFASTEIVPDELAEKTRLALDEARIGGRDLVDTIKRFERALRRV